MMKTLLGLVLFLTLFIPAVRGEGFVSLGGAADLIMEDPPPLAPDVRVQSGLDHYAPLSPEWSVFVSGALFGFWRPVDMRLRYLYNAAWNFSYRGGDFFFKTGLKAKGEQLYTAGIGWPDTFENVLDLYLAWDAGSTTFFIAPQLCYNREELIEDNVLVRGEAGLSFLPGERSVATLKLTGSFTLVPLHAATYRYGVEGGLLLYPDAPWFLSLSLGALIQDSDYTELVAGQETPRLDFFQLYASVTLSASLSDTVTLKVQLPARMSFKTMLFVVDGAFGGDHEWTLTLGPEAELSVTLAEHHELVFLLKAEPFFSNSDYYDAGYGEAAIRYQVNF